MDTEAAAAGTLIGGERGWGGLCHDRKRDGEAVARNLRRVNVIRVLRTPPHQPLRPKV